VQDLLAVIPAGSQIQRPPRIGREDLISYQNDGKGFMATADKVEIA
jgi:hypothetical protein